MKGECYQGIIVQNLGGSQTGVEGVVLEEECICGVGAYLYSVVV